MHVNRLEQDEETIRRTLQNGARLVACLCAEWCSSCRAWQDEFAALARQYPDDCFVWIDIEDHPELVAEIDFEIFPVLLIQNEDVLSFLGPVKPVPAVVATLLQRAHPARATFDDPGIFASLSA